MGRVKEAAPPAAADKGARDEYEKLSIDEALDKLGADPKAGLDPAEAAKRLEQYGPNAIAEEKKSALKQILSYFWGPIPWMIEVAAILSIVNRDWPDFFIIMFLLVFNAAVGFFQEHKAGNALEALKNQLAPTARVRRGGEWQDADAANLVPGDIVRVKLGDVIPADLKLVEGDYMSIDQAALTGESLPVTKKAGDVAYSGSIAKQGEMVGLVTQTGGSTFFGRTAQLVKSAGAKSHFQKAVTTIVDFLIAVVLVLAAILIAVELYRGVGVAEIIQFALVLVVASIPVASPAVLSVTMALGALALSRKKAIVSQLQAIEEMAGVNILCSDKTGTLTQNKLTLGDAEPADGVGTDELVLAGALASKVVDKDPIDLAVIAGLADSAALERYKQTAFVPFDPVGKRTEATVTGEDGGSFKVTKGAPQVILDMAGVEGEERARVDRAIDAAAQKGYRTLGVASSDGSGGWRFLGILPLFDPPRVDSAETIARAKEYGIDVKMVTGDNVAIGREISGQLGIGTDIRAADRLFGKGVSPDDLSPEAAESIERADGFAQVFPEHKYGIVKALQGRGNEVAMTGDGVNDAPALKQAEVGVAVSGATDAARAAAALTLTAPGLTVIISAVEEARRIFERMMSYMTYRIAMTIDIMVFVVIATLVFGKFPLSALMIIAIALLDDIPIMTIAYDNAYVDQRPTRWNMKRVIGVSTVLGAFSVVQSFVLLLLGRDHWTAIGDLIGEHFGALTGDQLQTLLFLQLVAAGHLLLFVTRSKKAFWMRPFPSWQLTAAIVGTQILAVLLSGFGLLVPALPWAAVVFVWIYNIVWLFGLDVVKMGVHKAIEEGASHKQGFLRMVNQRLHPAPARDE